MCVHIFAWRTVPGWPLVFAGNRDEYHARPTAAAGWWADRPGLLAGRDLEAGGTWLGVSRHGRFAVVTNVRAPDVPRRGARSRGELVTEYLSAGRLPAGRELQHYAAFNLLAGDATTLEYCASRQATPRPLGPGLHGLSNASLDAPWPKVERSKRRLAAYLDALPPGAAPAPERLLALLDDRTPAPDHELPATGVDRTAERFLSPPFVVGEDYGTRTTTAVLLGDDGGVVFVERTFDRTGTPTGTRRFSFPATPPPPPG